MLSSPTPLSHKFYTTPPTTDIDQHFEVVIKQPRSTTSQLLSGSKDRSDVVSLQYVIGHQSAAFQHFEGTSKLTSEHTKTPSHPLWDAAEHLDH